MAIFTFIQALAVTQAALLFGNVSPRKIHLEGRESTSLLKVCLELLLNLIIRCRFQHDYVEFAFHHVAAFHEHDV